MNFKYERLPNICYWCRCFDHSDKNCDLWIQSKGTLQLASQQFGSWLRAIPNASSNNRVIRVPGFYEGRKENLSTRWRRAESQKPIPVATSEEGHQLEKEFQNMEAEVMRFPGINSAKSTDFNKEREQSVRVNEISGDLFFPTI